MELMCTWRFNDKIGKWVLCVYANRVCVILVLRQSEAECEAWAQKNVPIIASTGKLPAYG